MTALLYGALLIVMYITVVRNALKLYKERNMNKNNNKTIAELIGSTIPLVVLFFLKGCNATAPKETGFVDFVDEHPEIQCLAIAQAASFSTMKAIGLFGIPTTGLYGGGATVIGGAITLLYTYDLCIKSSKKRFQEREQTAQALSPKQVKKTSKEIDRNIQTNADIAYCLGGFGMMY